MAIRTELPVSGAMMPTAAQLASALAVFRGYGAAGQDDRGDLGGERHAHHRGQQVDPALPQHRYRRA